MREIKRSCEHVSDRYYADRIDLSNEDLTFSVARVSSNVSAFRSIVLTELQLELSVQRQVGHTWLSCSWTRRKKVDRRVSDEGANSYSE